MVGAPTPDHDEARIGAQGGNGIGFDMIIIGIWNSHNVYYVLIRFVVAYSFYQRIQCKIGCSTDELIYMLIIHHFVLLPTCVLM